MTSTQPKTLKFREELAKLILSGQKNVTWRLFDEKHICEGDIVTLLVWGTLEPFATAKIVSVYEKRMGDLQDQDFEGHETFPTTEEMLETYSRYYQQPVSLQTKVKIIRFELQP